ncbi:MAG: type IV toxin-antitoxin system AbiEi family antitoxin domain-containing protein [Planctomycetia bacterium]|nr:type IV toxin-antitoxin system AbiEi family antitoxin domain-containing protein [Planctomycetia bacterium]
MTTVQDTILDRIRRQGRGKVFIPKDFLDLGSREATDQSLSRLVRSGDIQRLGRGLYHFPQVNERLGIPLSPDLDEIADALARQTGSRVVPSGAVAANQLGLSTQVPARPVYLSDGRTRQVRIGSTIIQIRHAAPKELPAGSRTSAMVFQALRHLGQAAVDGQVIGQLRRALSPDQRRALLRDARYTTDWIGVVIRQLAPDAEEIAGHG